MNKKVLILYTSVGLGHKTMAENIAGGLVAVGFDVRLEDILKIENGRLVEVGRKVHKFILEKTPWLWSYLYKSAWFTKLTLSLRTQVAAKHSQNAKLLLQSYNPDLVLCTQTTASAAVAYLKKTGQYTGLFGIAFSDFHLHRYWLYEQADLYLVNTQSQKKEMLNLGIEGNKIFVCGMNLPKKTEVDVLKIREKFSVGPKEKVCLIGSGSLGLGINEELVFTLSKKQNTKVIVVCGKNDNIYQDLKNKFAYTTVSVLKYYTPMAELYAIADIFISKPGGLSVSEALCWNLPVLVSHMLPGQEELNYEFLQDKGLVMPEPINLEEEIMEELESGSFKKSIKNNPQVFELLNGEIPATAAVLKTLEKG
jgi:processive 1,2-diacylglycerol beta-glucosyltransferase